MRLLLASVVIIAVSGLSWAEDGGKPRKGEGRPNLQVLLKKFDTNGDGRLDDAEKAKAREALKNRGGPGGAGAKGRPGGPGGKNRPDFKELIKKFDANGDGQLDDAERAKAREALKNRGKKAE